MKIYCELTLQATDIPTLKGEELDEALKENLELVEVDGYEVIHASVSRTNPTYQSKDSKKRDSELWADIQEKATRCWENIEYGKLPSKENKEVTNYEMLAWWIVMAYGRSK